MSGEAIAVLAAVAGPLVAYLVAARRFSGKIETTEAADLWAESRAIRDWSQERIRELQARLDEVDADRRECRHLLEEASRRLRVLEAAA